MEAHVDAGMLLKGFEKWQIAAGVRLLKDMAEIAAGLMGMNEQN